MKHSTPKLRYFAGCLMVHAAQGSDTVDFPSVSPVLAKMHPYLATLMGSRGFHALVVRAIALAATEVGWLASVHANKDGTLEGFPDHLDPAENTAGSVVLTASLLGLLESFIGEALTLHLVRDIWPDLPDEDNFTQGQKNEETT